MAITRLDSERISGQTVIVASGIFLASGQGGTVNSGLGVLVSGQFTNQSGTGVLVQSGLNVIDQSGLGVLISGQMIQVASGAFIASGVGVNVQSGLFVSISGQTVPIASGAYLASGLYTASGLGVLVQSGLFVSISGQTIPIASGVFVASGVGVVVQSGLFVSLSGQTVAVASGAFTASGLGVLVQSGLFVSLSGQMVQVASGLFTASGIGVIINSGVGVTASLSVPITSGSVIVSGTVAVSGQVLVTSGTTLPVTTLSGIQPISNVYVLSLNTNFNLSGVTLGSGWVYSFLGFYNPGPNICEILRYGGFQGNALTATWALARTSGIISGTSVAPLLPVAWDSTNVASTVSGWAVSGSPGPVLPYSGVLVAAYDILDVYQSQTTNAPNYFPLTQAQRMIIRSGQSATLRSLVNVASPSAFSGWGSLEIVWAEHA